MESTLPYGTWPSPLTATAVAAASARFDGARFVGGDVWWAEGVPSEAGRMAVRRRRPDGQVDDVLPAPWNARSRVHEYGGGAWTASDQGVLFFVEGADQRIWRTTPGAVPVPVTPESSTTRYGGLTWQHGRLLAVAERDTPDGTSARAVVEVASDGSGVRDLATGSDFVAQPALSPDGRRLAWVGWDHPAMPWDRTHLRVGTLAETGLVDVEDVTDGTTAAVQPTWLDDDELIFGDDPTGRWNLRRARPGSSTGVTEVAPADTDTGGALWVLGTRWYAPLPDGRLVAVRTQGSDEIVVVHPAADAATPLPLDVSAGASVEDVSGTHVLLVAAGRSTTTGLWLVDVDEPESAVAIAGAATVAGPGWLPRPRAITIDGPHGEVHAYAYPPTHPDVAAPDDELPPYLVLVHGGPTSHSGPSASAKVAYFTSRGIGVLDVNYGGSTGYGRAYRERLAGEWGVVDVDDVVAAASGIAAAGIADPARLAIEGGSAGGWTVLGALVRSEVFSAGVSRYGVGDARALAADTHDFESRYLDGLIGPLPDAEELYIERSPLTHADRLSAPLLILQGEEDRVVPPAQAEAIRDALRARGLPHAYVLYPGEGHGFRRRETAVHALESELAFLGQVFGFAPPGVPPIDLSIGSLSTRTTDVGREIVVDTDARGDLAADLALIVSREPERPLFARGDDEEWVHALETGGFTPVPAEETPTGAEARTCYVLPPTLDGA